RKAARSPGFLVGARITCGLEISMVHLRRLSPIVRPDRGRRVDRGQLGEGNRGDAGAERGTDLAWFEVRGGAIARFRNFLRALSGGGGLGAGARPPMSVRQPLAPRWRHRLS